MSISIPYVIPVVPSALHLPLFPESLVCHGPQGHFLLQYYCFMPSRQRMVVLAACFTLTARCSLLLKSTNLWCPHGEWSWSAKFWDWLATSAVCSDKVTKTWIDPLQLIKSSYFSKALKKTGEYRKSCCFVPVFSLEVVVLLPETHWSINYPIPLSCEGQSYYLRSCTDHSC